MIELYLTYKLVLKYYFHLLLSYPVTRPESLLEEILLTYNSVWILILCPLSQFEMNSGYEDLFSLTILSVIGYVSLLNAQVTTLLPISFTLQ